MVTIYTLIGKNEHLNASFLNLLSSFKAELIVDCSALSLPTIVQSVCSIFK